MRLLTFFIIASFSIGLTGCASQQINQWDSRVIQGQLDNGLRYFLYDSDNGEDPFNVRVMVHAGSIDEPEVMGIAHAVEHMVFNQTQAHPETIHSYIDELGWQTGKQINAVTTPILTQYMIRTRPGDSLDLPQSLELLVDMLGHAQFDAERWTLEQQIIQEEKRLGNHVAERVNQLVKLSTKEGSKYAEGPVIGTVESINAITVEDLKTFYQANYVASNMSLIIVGDFEPAEAKQAIHASFGTLPDAKKPSRDGLEFPLDERIKLSKVQDPEGTTSKVALGFRMAAPKRDTSAGVRLRLENYLLRKLIGPQIRRDRANLPEVIETMSGVLQLPSSERMILAFSARTKDHEAGLKEVLTEIERIRRYGFDAEEFAAAKARAETVAKRTTSSAANRDFAQWEDKIVNTLINGGALQDPQSQQKVTLKLLDDISLADLNQRFIEMTDAKDIFIYYQAPLAQTLELPSPQQVTQWRVDLEQATLAAPIAYTAISKPEQTSDAPSQTTEPKPVGLTKPTGATVGDAGIQHKELKVQEWHLSNGHKVIWLNRPTENNQIFLKAMTDAGKFTEQHPDWLMDAAMQLKLQAPLSGLTQEQWQAWQQQTGFAWQGALHDYRLDFSVAVSTEQLEAAFNALWLMHQPTQFTDEAVTAARDSILETAESMQDFDATNSGYYLRNGVRPFADLTPKRAEQVTQIQLENAVNELMNQPQELFIVGELGEQQLKMLIGRYLQPLQSEPSLTPKLIQQRDGQISASFERQGYNRAEVTIWGRVPMDWTPEGAFVVSTLNPIVQRALQKKLRLEMGGVYRVTFEMKLNPDTDAVESNLKFTSAPERAEELAEAAQRVLADLSDAIAQQNIGRIQADINSAEQGRLQIASTWSRRLMLSYRAYDDPRYLQTMQSLSEALTEASLLQLTREIFPMDNQIVIIEQYKPETVDTLKTGADENLNNTEPKETSGL